MNKDIIKTVLKRLFVEKERVCKCGVYLYRYDRYDNLISNTEDGIECYYCRDVRLGKIKVNPQAGA